MPEASILFFDNLNDFLPARRRQVIFTHPFEGAPSVKDMIESLGVPHPEIGLILVNNRPVKFDYHVAHGDSIHVYPTGNTLSYDRDDTVIPPPVEPRFVCDVHLGRLAAYLRMLGFDTLYPSDYRDEELARISSQDSRTLLTRDIGLLKRSIVIYGYFVRQTDPWRQLGEVVHRFHLLDSIVQFHRCTRCNAVLQPVDKADVQEFLPQETQRHYDEFRACHACGKVYWRGSHFEQMDAFIEQLRHESG